MKKLIKFFILLLVLVVFGISCTDELSNQYFEKAISSIGDEISQDIVFLDEVDGFSLSYESEDKNILSDDGKVTLPTEDTYVTIIISLDLNGKIVEKEYKVLVKAISLEELKEKTKNTLMKKSEDYSELIKDQDYLNKINGYITEYYNQIDSFTDINELNVFATNAINEVNGYEDLYDTITLKLDELENAFLQLPESSYTTENYQKLTKVYEDGITKIKNLKDSKNIDQIIEDIYRELYDIPQEGNKEDITKDRNEAITKVQEFYDSITLSLYSAENQKLISDLYTKCLEELNICDNILELNTIKDKFFDDIKNVKIENSDPDLENAKNEAITDLNNTVVSLNKNAYTESNYQEIIDIREEYTLLIYLAIDKENVSLLLSKAKEEINNVEVIIISKDKYILDYTNYFESFNKNNYTEENYQKLTECFQKGLEQINNSSLNQIEMFFDELYRELDDIPQIDFELQNAINSAIKLINDTYNAFDKTKYTNENYTLLTSIKDNALENILIANSIYDVDDLSQKAINDLNDVEYIKTDYEKCIDIEDDLASVLNLSGQIISNNITLKTSSLYNSTIIWTSSNESILSSTGIVGKDISKTKVTLSYKVILNDTTYDGLAIDIYVSTDVQLPSYYSSINMSLRGKNLKLALRTLVTSTHKKVLSYGDLKTAIPKTDVDPNNSGNLILFYMRTSVSSKWDGGNTWNREHVWPQSMSWFTTSGAGADVHHLRPTNNSANSSRGNKPYSEISNREANKKTINGVVYGYASSKYFEPKDEVKGDVARIILYLLVRYSESDSYPITNVIQSYDMLLRWNKSDPVDDFEIYRNQKSYEIQGNRNPFIDYPDFATMMFSSSGLLDYEDGKNEASEIVFTFDFLGNSYEKRI